MENVTILGDVFRRFEENPEHAYLTADGKAVMVLIPEIGEVLLLTGCDFIPGIATDEEINKFVQDSIQ